MVLDLMLGGDLRFHLDRNGNMREDIVRFYVAELSLALDYLHGMQIVHRDLKPDNVLLDDRGHVALTDFNIAVHYSARRMLTSVAGSMAYMAPEVLSKRGYRSAVDWWSLGVMVYEMLFGHRPFKGKTNSSLTNIILHAHYVFPDNIAEIVSPEAVSFIKDCLERDPAKRLGTRGLSELQAHPWFNGMDWTAIANKEITPPFQPDVSVPPNYPLFWKLTELQSKRANFDASHELEELLLEENPLKARRRKEDVDLDSLSPEMRYMEEHFLPFDHLKQRRKSYFPNGDMSRANSSQVDQPLGETAPMVIPATTLAAPGQMYPSGLAAPPVGGVSPTLSATRAPKPSGGSVYPPSAGSRPASRAHSHSSRAGSRPERASGGTAATQAHLHSSGATVVAGGGPGGEVVFGPEPHGDLGA